MFIMWKFSHVHKMWAKNMMGIWGWGIYGSNGWGCYTWQGELLFFFFLWAYDTSLQPRVSVPLNSQPVAYTVGSILTINVSQINLCQPAFGESHSQSQARLMFVTTLGMDNFDCIKMNAHFKKFRACLLDIYPWYLLRKSTVCFHQMWLSHRCFQFVCYIIITSVLRVVLYILVAAIWPVPVVMRGLVL